MREMLVPIFGEWGAVVAQFLLTVVIVFGLIGLVWWLVRRYSGVRFSGIGRGRVPRLAVLDVMPVDRRRKLVLVRRDNVEHLIMIGGPSDLVVEGSIQRVRQRGAPANAAQQAQLAAARAAMQPAIAATPAAEHEPAPAEAPEPEQPQAGAPIPFPLARNAQPLPAASGGRSLLRHLRRPSPTAPAADEPAATAAFVEPQRPTRTQPMPSRPAAPTPPPASMAQRETAPPAAHRPPAESLVPDVAAPEATPPSPAARAPATFAEAEWEAAEEARQSALDLGDIDGEAEVGMDAPATAAEPEGPPPAAGRPGEPASPESPASVGDLEREMARLLDEITTRRSS